MCIDYVLPLVPLLTLEGEDPEHLDARLPLPDSVKTSAELVLSHVDRFASAGAALWPPVASSLYGAFLRGDTARQFVAVITWDTARTGVGCLIRTREVPDGLLVVSTFGPDEVHDAQVHIEAAGGCVSLEAASRVVNLRGATVIFRNDATGALAAFRRGSAHSPTLQALAVRMTTLCAELGISPLFLHAPGKDLVEERIDDASRRLASAIAEPALPPALRSLVHEVAAGQGWSISVDLFATASSCLVDRFFSEYAEPKAEAVDAIAVTDWHCSACPHCRLRHRETVFAFPPRVLIRRFIAKAREDGVRGVVIVPFAITAPYWPRLVAASRPVGDKPFIHIRNPGQIFTGTRSFLPPALAVFAVDFATSSSRRFDAYAPACGQEGAWRGRPLLGHPNDVADRQRIRHELERLYRAADAGVPPSSLPAL